MRKNSFQLSFMLVKALLTFLFLRPCDTTTTTAAYYNFDLSTTALDPSINGFTMKGDIANSAFGRSVSTAGDINNDGYADVIIGAPFRSSNQGAAYVIYGKETASLSNIDLSTTTLDPATTGFKLIGNAAGSNLGISVSTAGDIDNDGYDDIIIGAYGKDSNKGTVYVIYGGEKSSMQNFDFSIATTFLDPTTTGFVISGNGANNQLGISVRSVGDINKDGYDDMIMGASKRNTNQGAAYVIYGGSRASMKNIDLSSPTALDPLTTGFTMTGSASGDYFGWSVNTAGDINKDGYDDIIIGAYGKNTVYVVYGGEKSSMTNLDFSIATTILDPATTGFIVQRNVAGDEFGWAVSTAGDIDQDGYDDIIIGASGANSFQGKAFVIYGGEKSSMKNLDFTSITALDPVTTGFMMTGNVAPDQFGVSVSRAGDMNKDGYPDILIAANLKNAKGVVYVIYGGKKSSMSNIDLSSPTTILDPLKTGFMISAHSVSNGLGWSVRTAGDVNNDGFEDIIFGAHGKDNKQGAVYVIHSACSQCWNCPTNCIQCSSPSLCLQCSSPSLLYDSQCLTYCPVATWKSTNMCKDCPPYCSSCTSSKICQACESGYTLSNSICVIPSLSAGSKALQAVSSSSQGIGSLVCAGSTVFPLSAIVSKIVQNTRYLNLSVTNELADIYQTWGTDFISWQVPNGFSRLDHFRASPALFSKYEIDSPFLVNFWPTLITIAVGWTAFVTLFGLRKSFERAEYNKGWIYSLLKKFVIGSFNFALVQTYGCLDDIIFYLILDVKSNPFGNFFSWTSFLSAFAFIAIGCLLIFFNFWIVKKYQAVKGHKDLEAFNEKNKYWELFYSDFNDNDFWSQSFLPLLIIRSSISSLIIAALYDVVMFQTASLLILDGAVLLFLLSKKPFNTLRGKIAQYYFEIITLLVHFCTFLLSLNRSSEGLRVFLSGAIIYLNTALVSGSTAFMFIEIYETIKEKAQAKRDEKLVGQKIVMEEETLNTQNHNLTETKLSGIKLPRRLNKINDEQEKSENSISGLNIQRLDSNLNGENSVLSEMNTSNLTSARRDQSSLSIMIRRRPLNLKQQQQQREISMIKNHDLNFESFEEN